MTSDKSMNAREKRNQYYTQSNMLMLSKCNPFYYSLEIKMHVLLDSYNSLKIHEDRTCGEVAKIPLR